MSDGWDHDPFGLLDDAAVQEFKELWCVINRCNACILCAQADGDVEPMVFCDEHEAEYRFVHDFWKIARKAAEA